MASLLLSTRHAIASRAAASTPASPTSPSLPGVAAISLRRGPARRHVAKECVLVLKSKFSGAAVGVAPVSSSTPRRYASSNPALSPLSVLVQKVTANELDSILTDDRTSPLIIDFYATWCGPCVVLAQQLEELAMEYGEDVRFLKVDTDEEHELAAQMEIRGLPTMVFVSKDVDKLAIRTEGLLPTTAIRDIIEKEILV